MSKIKIEDYRGFEISFDTEAESFYAFSDRHDRESEKKSFAAIRKDIDEYIKENQGFKPFRVTRLPGSVGIPSLDIVGIRKDGVFVYTGIKNKTEQLSKYDEKYYILYNHANEAVMSEISALKAQEKEIRDKMREAEAKITGTTLIDYKKSLQL